jgi:mitogen-activated protein kinase kinase
MIPPTEADGDAGPSAESSSPSPSETEDPEVAAWAKAALERRQRGLGGDTQKPALHAVALDAVGSPLLEEPSPISPSMVS